MTDQFPSPTPPTGPEPQQPVSQAELKRQAREAKAVAKANRNWFARHKMLTGLGVAGVIVVSAVATNGDGGEPPAADPVAAVADSTPAVDVEDTSDEAVVEPEAASEPEADVADEATEPEATVEEPAAEAAEEDAADGATVAQQNALESAQSYLEYSGFSKAGLMDQLTSEYGEGFEKADAEWAIEHVDADWKAEAVESAESYLEYDSFSRTGLIDQLSSEYGEQFTAKQAEYAADQVGL